MMEVDTTNAPSSNAINEVDVEIEQLEKEMSLSEADSIVAKSKQLLIDKQNAILASDKEIKDYLESDKDKDNENTKILKALCMHFVNKDKIENDNMFAMLPMMVGIDQATVQNKLAILRNTREVHHWSNGQKEHKVRLNMLEQNQLQQDAGLIEFQKAVAEEVQQANHKLYFKYIPKANKNALHAVQDVIAKLLDYKGYSSYPRIISVDPRHNNGRIMGIAVLFADYKERDLISRLAVDIPRVFGKNTKISINDEIPRIFLDGQKIFYRISADLQEIYGGRTRIRMDFSSKRLVLMHGLPDQQMFVRFTYSPAYHKNTDSQLLDFDTINKGISKDNDLKSGNSPINDINDTIIFRRAYPDDSSTEKWNAEYVVSMIANNSPQHLLAEITNKATTKNGFIVQFSSEEYAKAFFSHIKGLVFSHIHVIGSYLGDVTDHKIDLDKIQNDRIAAVAYKAGEKAKLEILSAASQKEGSSRNANNASNKRKNEEDLNKGDNKRSAREEENNDEEEENDSSVEGSSSNSSTHNSAQNNDSKKHDRIMKNAKRRAGNSSRESSVDSNYNSDASSVKSKGAKGVNKSSNGKYNEGGRGGQGGHRGGKNNWGNRGKGRGRGLNHNKDDRWSYKNQNSRHGYGYDDERGYGSQGYYGDYRRDHYNDRERYDNSYRNDRYNRY